MFSHSEYSCCFTKFAIIQRKITFIPYWLSIRLYFMLVLGFLKKQKYIVSEYVLLYIFLIINVLHQFGIFVTIDESVYRYVIGISKGTVKPPIWTSLQVEDSLFGNTNCQGTRKNFVSFVGKSSVGRDMGQNSLRVSMGSA